MARRTETLRLAMLALGITATSLHAAGPLALTGETMGTTWSVKLIAPAPPKLHPAIQSRLDELEAALSTYRDDSEVSRFNRTASTSWFPVSADTALVVAEALRVSRATDGAFDITIGPLVELWGFGKARRNFTPATHEIAAVRARVGWKRLEVRHAPPALRKSDSAAAIDLSGIGKGFAADAVSALLSRGGITNHLVQIGGEFLARGRAADGQPWRVGIEDAAHPGEILRVVELTDRALSTSGNYRNFHEQAGRRYGHILDPRTGWPAQSDLAGVSVMAASSATADAMATALFVIGSGNAATVAARLSVECILNPR